MKILLIDLESAPNTAHLWGLFNQNVGLPQLMESSYVLCFAAKWLGERDMIWERSYGKRRKGMLRKVYRLLDKADIIITYNGSRFDLPTLNKEFIIHHIPQPSPYQQMDLLKVVRGRFRFTSNKLDYICQTLGLGRKTRHQGHDLWVGCMNGDEKCWAKMEQYNRQDVRIMEKLYRRLLPWIKTHPSKSMRKVADMLMGEK
jgi:uncharacterized protein YprB with RNaseH-like and TPR domain